jgi:hypothetical protein
MIYDLKSGSKRRGDTRQTKPNLGGMGHLGDGVSGRPVVRHRLDAPLRETKPIVRLRIGTDPQRAARFCQTNPIWPGALGLRRRNAPNKPNLPPASRQSRRRGRLYKQTQSDRKWLNENRLWCIGHSGELHGYKAGPRRPVRKPPVQTKPNPPGSPETGAPAVFGGP